MWVFFLCKQWLGGWTCIFTVWYIFLLLATYRRQKPKCITLARMCATNYCRSRWLNITEKLVLSWVRRVHFQAMKHEHFSLVSVFVSNTCRTHEHSNTPPNGHALNTKFLLSVCSGWGGNRRSKAYHHVNHQIRPQRYVN